MKLPRARNDDGCHLYRVGEAASSYGIRAKWKEEVPHPGNGEPEKQAKVSGQKRRETEPLNSLLTAEGAPGGPPDAGGVSVGVSDDDGYNLCARHRSGLYSQRREAQP